MPRLRLRFFVVFLAIYCTVVPLALPSVAARPRLTTLYELDGVNRLPARWGGYTVRIRNWDTIAMNVVIEGRDNRIDREVDGGTIYRVYTVKLESAGQPSLVFEAGDGSNLRCQVTDFVYSQTGGLHNVAIVRGGWGDFE